MPDGVFGVNSPALGGNERLRSFDPPVNMTTAQIAALALVTPFNIGGPSVSANSITGWYVGGGSPLVAFNANVFGTAGASVLGATYTFNTNSDTMDSTAAIGSGSYDAYFGHVLTAGAKGGRTAVGILLNQTAATVPGVGGFYAALGAVAQAAFSAGGATGAGNARGNLFGANPSAILLAGAGLYWNSLVGEEVDISAAAGTGIVFKTGHKVVQLSTDVVQGTSADYAYGIGNQNSGAAPGWNTGFAFGVPEGWWPIKSTGTLIGTYAALTGGGPAMAAAIGIDFSAITFSATPLKMPLMVNQPNDAGAGGAGVPVGGFYRNGSIVMQRAV